MVNKLVLFLIFILALFLRTWNLSNYPVSLSMDEAAIGYNAYSLLKTGHDEFNEILPLAFRSAGDYKPPVNFYLAVPSVAIFGLNELGIRFPTALMGALTAVVFVYFLISIGISKKASYFGGFWLAVLPWHIHFSRATFEAVTALFFVILGTTLFIYWIKNLENKWLAVLSAIALSLSVWAYHAERLFVPLLVLFLFFMFRKNLPKQKINVVIFVLTAAIFAIPFAKLAFLTPAIKERAASTSILREQSLVLGLHTNSYQDLATKIFDHDGYLIYRHWLGKYLNYFDLRFWFWKGIQLTPPGYPDLGLLYVIDLPLFMLGIYQLLKSKDRNLKTTTGFWFFVGVLPASFTMNEQHPLRALIWLPFFGIIMAAGFEYLLDKFKIKKILFFYTPLLLVNFVYFADVYLNQFPRHFSEYWQYGYKEAAIYACQNQQQYDEIVVTDTFGSDGPLNTGLPYLYFLTYCPWNRDNFLATGSHYDKIKFRRPNREDFDGKKKRLLIGAYWDFLDGLDQKGTTIKTINYLNGKTGFLLIEANKK